MNYFVTGIGTDVGKTIVSAVLVQALGADYWKPIQCGLPRDTETVSSLVKNKTSTFHPETYLLKEPASPHQAAFKEGLTLRVGDINVPNTKKDLVIEGAGGIMVPLNNWELMLDLIKNFADEVVLVASLYLGSINHTLLSIDALQRRGIAITGIVFNGPSNSHSESLILSYSGSVCLLRLKPDSKIDPANIKKWARKLKANMKLTS